MFSSNYWLWTGNCLLGNTIPIENEQTLIHVKGWVLFRSMVLMFIIHNLNVVHLLPFCTSHKKLSMDVIRVLLLLFLTLNPSWWRSISYRNQSIDLQSKSMDWFLYDADLRHERVKQVFDLRLIESYFKPQNAGCSKFQVICNKFFPRHVKIYVLWHLILQ